MAWRTVMVVQRMYTTQELHMHRHYASVPLQAIVIIAIDTVVHK